MQYEPVKIGRMRARARGRERERERERERPEFFFLLIFDRKFSLSLFRVFCGVAMMIKRVPNCRLRSTTRSVRDKTSSNSF